MQREGSVTRRSGEKLGLAPPGSQSRTLALLTPVHESALYSRPPEGMNPPACPTVEIPFWALQHNKVKEQIAVLGHNFRCPLGAVLTTSPEHREGQQSPGLMLSTTPCGQVPAGLAK